MKLGLPCALSPQGQFCRWQPKMCGVKQRYQFVHQQEWAVDFNALTANRNSMFKLTGSNLLHPASSVARMAERKEQAGMESLWK